MQIKNIVTIEDRVTILPQKLAELSRQLIMAETKRKELKDVYENVRGVSYANAESVPIIFQNKTIQSLKKQILAAEQKIDELSKIYGPKYPSMIKARDELNMLLKKRKLEIDRIKESAKTEYELAIDFENNIKTSFNQTKAEAVKLNEKFIQYGMLKRDVESNRSIFNALIQSLKEISVTEQTQTANVWVVEKAEPPEFASYPNTRKNILLGVVLGLFGGIGFVFFLEYLDNTIKSPSDLEDRLKVPVLGSVALIKSANKSKKFKNDVDSNLIISKESSSYVESYKTIRTALLLSSAENPPRRMLVTSAVPGEGKTTTAANLAVTIAKTGKKVLLVDSDLRRPKVHKLFDLDNSTGLSSILAGIIETKTFLQQGPVDTLSIIPSGPIPPDPAELLSSKKFEELIASWSTEFDFLILDSPPVLSTPDSLLLSRLVDGTILIANFNKTTFDAAQKAIKSFADINTHILGIIINKVNLSKSSYYYYDYSHNYYYYKSEE